MSIWVWPVNQENWPTVKSEKVWAVSVAGKGKKVTKGDRIIFYVNGTMFFQGIYEVISDWHKPSIKWSHESYVGEKEVAEIDLEEIQLGYASVNKLLPSLNFIEKKKGGLKGLYLRGTPQGPANSGKPISDSDYELIRQELKSVQIEPDFKKLKEEVNEIEELVEVPETSFEIEKIPTPEKKTIEEIFNDVEKGRYAIPDFQRYWTWNRSQIEQLWESIFQAYYIGSLLHWEAKEPKLGMTAVQGAPEYSKNPDLVLDGQQRITAIYYAIKAPPIALPNTDKPYVFFLNINALLDPLRNSSEIIEAFSTTKAKRRGFLDRETQFARKIFPLTELQNKNYSDWLFGFYDYLQKNEGFDDVDAKKYHKKLESIFSYVWSSYEIPVVKLPESLNLENVATVFERINSKGTPLGVFDLLNARFIIHEIILKNLWEEAKDVHENLRKWYEDFKNEKVPLYILEAMALSRKGYLRRSQILNLDDSYKISGKFQKEEFLKDWDEMTGFVEESIKRLTSRGSEGYGAVNYELIPYSVMVTIMACFLKEIENRPDRTKCLEKIGFWYWNNILGDKYSGSTDSTGESDFKEMKAWFDNDDLQPFDLEEKSGYNTSKGNSAIYKAIMCLVAKKGALDFIRDDPPEYSSLEDHHIFPRSKAKKYNAEKDIDSILNRTLIFEKTNRYISNKDPSSYLKEIMNEQKIGEEKMKQRLSTHVISPKAFECMLKDDFYGFIKAREETIREEFMKLTKKI
ncbi:MAG: DUF262 domain-containing protein [Nitrosopumilaceae archaeon]